jgi:hypothetical protein
MSPLNRIEETESRLNKTLKRIESKIDAISR